MSEIAPNNRYTEGEVKTLLEDIRSEWRPVIEGWQSLVGKVDFIAGTVSRHEDRLIQLDTSHQLLHREMKEVTGDIKELKVDVKELKDRVGALETKFA